VIRPLALALLLLLAGCGGGPGADCTYPTDCDEGLACFAGTCHELGEPAGTIAWEVLPPSSSPLGPASFPPAEGPLAFSLCRSSVRGTLEGGGGALLVARGEPASIAGHEVRFERHVRGEFTMDLPPGAWTLTFQPDPPGPPPLIKRVQLARCEQRELSLLEWPADRVLRLRPVIDPERDPRQACGAFVRVYDPAGGAPLSSRLELRSRPGGACPGPAESTLRFAPPAGDEIEVRIGPLDAVLPTLPEQTLRVKVEGEGDLNLGPVALNPGALALERVLVAVSDVGGQAISRAIVTAESVPAGEESSIRFRSGAGREVEAGRYELWLMPGRYRFRAIPPEGADAAAGGCVVVGDRACESTHAVVAERPASVSLALPRPVRFRGSADGVSGGTVELRPAREGGGRSSTAPLSADGRWDLAVDPGNYDLVLRPSAPATPWLVRPLSAPLVADAEEEVSMPEPALVIGTLWEGDTGETLPVAGALVRAWRLAAEGPPHLVGEAVSRADGTFSLVLPGN